MLRFFMLITDEQGNLKEVVSPQEAMERLNCERSTIRLYLKNGQITGALVFDEKRGRDIRWIFLESIEKFQRRSAGRPEGSKDKDKSPEKRIERSKIASKNGRLAKGIPKRKKR